MSPENFSHLHCSVRSGESSEKPVFDENEVFLSSRSPKKWIAWEVGLDKLEVLSQGYMPIKNQRGISRNGLHRRSSLGGVSEMGRPFYEPGHVNLDPICLRRSSHILLNLTYVIEGSILRIVTQVVSKNMNPLIIQGHSIKRPTKVPLPKQRS